ncbi:hypothetical protein Tco_1201035 [Tanacetum coccineum]
MGYLYGINDVIKVTLFDVINYQGDTFQNDPEDPLTSIMILLAHETTHRYSIPTNNRLQSSSNTRNQAAVQADKVNIQSRNEMLQTFSATIAVQEVTMLGIIQSKEFRILKTEEFSADICMIAKIQPTNIDSDEGPSYDSAFISEVKTPSTSFINPLFSNSNQEQTYHEQPKIINSTTDRDKIRALENEIDDLQLNVLKQRKQVLELKTAQTSLKHKLNTNEDKYIDDVLNLEAKLKRNENVVMKIRHAPPSPDYVPGPEHPPSSDYVPRPEYPEYLVPTEDPPLPANASPTALSPGYVVDSDPEEDLKEDPKEDPAEYLVDGGEEKEQEESFKDDADDEDAEEDSEEEHLASADSTTLLVVDPLPSADDTEVFETDESASTPPVTSPRLCRARVSVRPQTPMSAAIEALIAAFEVEEVRQLSAMQLDNLAHRVDYGFIETMDASIQAAKSRAMTAIGEVNERVTNLTTTQRQETYELQRIRDEDRLMSHIHHEHDRFKEPEPARDPEPQDGPADAGSSC